MCSLNPLQISLLTCNNFTDPKDEEATKKSLLMN